MIRKGTPPVATYRLQLNKDFTFQDVLPIIDYLKRLGISHLYLSPVFESVPGSNHGYDTLDFKKISAERGGEQGLRDLDAALRAMDPPMKIILDIVPNHMGAHLGNPYWFDVLEKGERSPYWKLFDLRPGHDGKIQLPVLGETMDDLLARNEAKLVPDGGKIRLSINDKLYPLAQDSVDGLKAEAKGKDLPTFLDGLPADRLRMVLDAQAYRLVHWTSVREAVAYRRFFDITDLIGVRVEDPAVYELTHGRLIELAKELTSIDGVRVDHVDGLVDPGAYLDRLAKDFGQVWIEKILGRDEIMPKEWPVNGTTGYEFIDRINRLFVNAEGFGAIEAGWRQNEHPVFATFRDAVIFGKNFALDILFPAELKRLAALSTADDNGDDNGMAQAALFWKGLTMFMPVYRTYADDRALDNADAARIGEASEEAAAHFGDDYAQAAARFLPLLVDPQTDRQRQARREWQQLSGPVMAKGLEDTAHYNYTPLAALNDVGCEANVGKSGAEGLLAWLQDRARDWPLAMKATTTHDTKRSEDVRARLYVLSDMPKEWRQFVDTARAANAALKSHGAAAPGAAEEYFLYQAILGTWPADGEPGADYADRIAAYMLKDIKEAKQKTSWLDPDQAYEKEIDRFTRAVLGHAPFLDALTSFAAIVAPAGAACSLAVQTLKILSPGVPDIYQGTEGWDLSLVDPDNRRPVDYGRLEAMMDSSGQGADRVKALTENWQDGAVKIWLTKTLLRIRRDVMMPMGGILMQKMRLTGAGADRFLAYALVSDSGQKGGIVVILPYTFGSSSLPRHSGLSAAALQDMDIVLPETLEGLRNADLLTGRTLEKGTIDAAALLRDFPIAVVGCDL